MIQKTQGRRSDGLSSHRSGYDMEWGKWVNDKYYSLEVVQHPIRARMCGFGDKDRRPLAPAAVVKMIVKDKHDHLISVDDTDVAFFVVTVDLWSEDGSQEMNLVLHPSSADRYVPAHMPRPRKSKPPSSLSGLATPTRSSMPSPSMPPQGFGSVEGTPLLAPEYPSYPFPPTAPPAPMHSHPDPSVSLTSPYPPPAYGSSPWGYGQSQYQPQPGRNNSLPPIASLKDQQEGSAPSSTAATGPGSYRAWGTDTDEVYLQDTPQPPPPSNTSHSLESMLTSDIYSYPPPAMSAPPPPPPTQNQNPYYAPPSPPSPGPQLPPLPRHTYTRTLVGPLSANACRLQDEHRKPGIFFLFQDLSVRTEGTFRLRMRLMCVGGPPAPEWGAQAVTTGVAPVLAQTFTGPFIVYSAKRFPGVPDTTALSIAFGNQGQKLPLRNRHGSQRSVLGRRRRRGSDDEDDSGGD